MKREKTQCFTLNKSSSGDYIRSIHLESAWLWRVKRVLGHKHQPTSHREWESVFLPHQHSSTTVAGLLLYFTINHQIICFILGPVTCPHDVSQEIIKTQMETTFLTVCVPLLHMKDVSSTSVFGGNLICDLCKWVSFFTCNNLIEWVLRVMLMCATSLGLCGFLLID